MTLRMTFVIVQTKNTMLSYRVVFSLFLLVLTTSSLADTSIDKATGGDAHNADAPKVGVAPAGVTLPGYKLQAGDVITVSVWKEQDLQSDVLVRPDGSFSFPLAGEVDAVGKTVDDVRLTLVDRLKRFIPNPVVTVAVKVIGGNRIYVVGRVVHAGDFPLSAPIDVMQAIALAGGTTPFAAINDIVILRRQNGQQQPLHFHYSDVARGKDLSQNVLLQSGDTVVVP